MTTIPTSPTGPTSTPTGPPGARTTTTRFTRSTTPRDRSAFTAWWKPSRDDLVDGAAGLALAGVGAYGWTSVFVGSGAFVAAMVGALVGVVEGLILAFLAYFIETKLFRGGK